MAFISREGSVFGCSLFERLEADAPKLSVTQVPTLDEIMGSIKRNITQLLNTRLGDSLSSPELGLADFNDVAMSENDVELSIRRGIRHCLEKYEPRIFDIDICAIPDSTTSLALRFQIVASVYLGSLCQKVHINLLFDNNKQYRVI